MTQTLPIKIDKGEGEITLVLLHGLGTNHQSWKYVLDALNYTTYRVIAVDLLGFGDAPKPKIAYKPEDHAKVVIRTLEKAGITQAVLVGHSMGCVVALEVARLQPNLADKLILLGAPLYKTIPTSNRWKRFLKIEGVYFSLFNAIKKHPDLTIDAAKAADTLLPLLHGMEITEETWPAFHASLNNTIMQTHSYAVATKVKTPTLLVYGALDIFVSKQNLLRVHRSNKHISLKYTLGPHEITPLQGKRIAKFINKFTAT